MQVAEGACAPLERFLTVTLSGKASPLQSHKLHYDFINAHKVKAKEGTQPRGRVLRVGLQMQNLCEVVGASI